MSRLLGSFAILLLAAGQIHAQSVKKYFGYFYNDVPSYNGSVDSFAENQDHINLLHIDNWSGLTTADGRATTATYVLSELAKAKQAGVKAIITGAPFVFQTTNVGMTWTLDSAASQSWADFVSKLTSAGYLIPGDPDGSTVIAVYLVDEPNGHGLADQNGSPNSVLSNAVNVIRANPSTSKLPIASIVNSDLSSISGGIKLFDWVGFDQYGVSQATWSSTYNELKSYMTPNQKTILVSLAAACTYGGTKYDSPQQFGDALNNYSEAIWLAPYVWWSSSASCPGARDLSALRSAYIQIGKSIKISGCGSSAAEANFCNGGVDISPIIDFIMND